MKTAEKQPDNQAEPFKLAIKKRSDGLMNYFLPAYFLIGILLAWFYSTWIIAFGIGGICLLAYYSVKLLMPESNMYQYVLSAAFGVFMAQFIYQMHGLFEMHFFAFIGSALLITFQNWKLQMPILIVVFIHHAIFSFIQNLGYSNIYFTQLDYFDLQTFIIHILLTAFIFFICGLWAYQLKKYSESHIAQALQMAELKKEVHLSIERKLNAEKLAALNQILEHQAKELKFSNDELEQFAYVASHDLQEPLRMITNFVSLLEKRYVDLLDTKGKQYIYFAVDGAKRMRQIITDLLAFSRVGRTEDKLEEVDLQDLMNSICILNRKIVQDKGAKIFYNGLPTLRTYRAPIRQVFQNLVSNALKYQQNGNLPVITIAVNEQPNQYLFSVNDNGIGIEAEYFEKIFVIFQRLHSREQYSGTGLGLAITKKIVENLGGNIWVESEEGKGSTFYFTMLKQMSYYTPSTESRKLLSLGQNS